MLLGKVLSGSARVSADSSPRVILQPRLPEELDVWVMTTYICAQGCTPLAVYGFFGR